MADVTMRLRALDLPHPIHPLLDSVLSADNVDARHEDLVNAWEAVLKVTACTMWAVRRAVGAHSQAFDDLCRGLARPAFGHWAGLVREGHLLLRDRPEAEARVLRPLCEGLERRLDDFPGMAALADLMPEAPKGGVRVEGRQLQALAQALSSYRNITKGHEGRDSAWREHANDALWNALLDWCEACPPTGSARVVVVHGVAHEGQGRVARLARMHGHGQPKQHLPVTRETADLLRPGRPFLFADPGLFVPLFPVAAAEPDGDRWRLGWLKERVREPRFAFDAFPAGSFQVRLDTEDYLALMGAANAGEDPVLPETVLALDPWQGLPAYDERHAPVFFGREEETETAVARLRRDGCLLLCGASGAGKSSLMKAGVLARLREEAERDGVGLSLVSFAPGPAPIEALRGALRGVDPGPEVEPAAWWSLIDQFLPAEATRNGCDGLQSLVAFLARNGRRVVVAIDQMEEAATLCTDPAQRTRFLGLVAEAGLRAREAQAWVAATVRADLLGGLLEHPGFRALADGRMLLLGGMGRERLRRVVTDPLRGRGIELEPGLDEVIASDVGDEPGSLALLSQVLRTLWDERALYGRRLTREGYESAGRVAGALRRQADQARTEALGLPLTDASNPAAADLDRVLLQLAQAGGDRTFSRRVVRQADVAAATGMEPITVRALLEPFVARRMLVSGGGDATDTDVVAVAHEALFTAWPHFRELLQARKEALVLRGQIEAAADAWERSGRRRELWTDGTSRLRRAEELQAEGRLDLGGRERVFLTTCRKGVQRRRRLGWIVSGALAVLLVGAIGAGWAAIQLGNRASVLAATALEDQGRNQLLAGHPMHALLFLVEAERRQPNKPSVRFLLSEASRSSVDAIRLRLSGHVDRVLSATFSPDGTRVLTASKDKTAILWDVATGSRIGFLAGHLDALSSANFSPDGTRIVTASRDRTAAIWDGANGNRLVVLNGHTSQIRLAMFSPDGTRVVTASLDSTAAVWDATNGQRIAVLAGHRFGVFSAVFNQNGTQVLTASGDGTAALWNAETGQRLAVFTGHDDAVYSAAFASDGKRVITASGDNTAAIWDVTSGRRLVALEGHSGWLRSANFNPDGTIAVTASTDKTAILWDASSGQRLAVLRGHSDGVYSAVFSPDGTRVATASGDHTAAIWDVASGTRLVLLEGHQMGVFSAVFSPDGTGVVTASADETAVLWDLDTGRNTPILTGHSGEVWSAVFSRDGTRIVTASGDDTAIIWDAVTGGRLAVLEHPRWLKYAAFNLEATRVVTVCGDNTAHIWHAVDGRRLAILRGHSNAVNSASFSPDGNRVVTSSADGTASIWNALDGRDRLILHGHSGEVQSAVFSPDGRRVVTASVDKNAIVWDALTGRELLILRGHSDSVHSAVFSPDGTLVLTSSADETAALWEAATGRRLKILKGHHLDVNLASFSPDGIRIVTAGSDKTALLWQVDTGRRIAALGGHSGAITSAVFSPDGTQVLTASTDAKVIIWNASTGQMLTCLEAHSAGVSSAAFDANGTRVVTASEDTTARIWNIRTNTRSIEELDQLVQQKLPIRLVDGLVVADPPQDRAFTPSRHPYP